MKEIVVYKGKEGVKIIAYSNNEKLEEIPLTERELNSMESEISGLCEKYDVAESDVQRKGFEA